MESTKKMLLKDEYSIKDTLNESKINAKATATWTDEQ